MECPGCFQIKWISCFGTRTNLGSREPDNEGKSMILFYAGFLLKEQMLTNNVPFKCCFVFLSSSFGSPFPPPLLLMSFLELICNQFWKYLIQFLCFISVLTSYKPRKFLPVYLHQPSLQNNIELAPGHGDNTTCCQLGEFGEMKGTVAGLRPGGGSRGSAAQLHSLSALSALRRVWNICQLSQRSFPLIILQLLCRGIIVIL